MNILLETAAEKASLRRFTAEPPTGFGALLDFPLLSETDNLTANIEAIWGLEPLVEISLGIPLGDYSCTLNWSHYSFTRSQAAKALRYCRREQLRIERGYRKGTSETSFSVSDVGRDQRDVLLAEVRQ